jgi:hypothetical protein
MKLSQFIEENRAELDACINRVLNHVPKEASCNCPKSRTDHYHDSEPLSNSDRKEWIINDESLYNWARSAGCRI